MSQSVLVTGGAGYVGTKLVPKLLARGYRVTIFDTFDFGLEPCLSFSDHPGLELIRGSVCDAELIRQVVSRHDWVLHLAAVVGFPSCSARPFDAQNVNVVGTENIVRAMHPDQRLLFASTGSTYGKVKGGPATEETPIAPLTLYGRTKADAEALIRERCQNYSILRFVTVFGVSPRLRLDLLVNDFVWSAVVNRQIVLFEGHFLRSFLHVDDSAESYLFCMDNFEKMNRSVFNVGDPRLSFTKRQLAHRIKDHVEYYLHEAEVAKDPDQRDYDVDFSKLMGLGFQAKYDLDEGIRGLVKIVRCANVERNRTRL